MPPTAPPVSSVLPPLILGTATFNNQYNPDPYALPTTGIVHRALSLGVRAFDTSPYYGPAEELLGQALDTDFVHKSFPRKEYYILTKVGRIAGSEFDYSAAWVRKSVQRSLQRLKTDYLDVVYCHDVEFVSAAEVLTAVTELRRIRDEQGTIKYVGISGYPVEVLCELSEMIWEKTGEAVDIIMSYANYTVQNTRLASVALPRIKAAGVDVIANASVLGMGLLRSNGVPIGAQGDWHPAPDELRSAIQTASQYCEEHDDKLEKVAIRWAMESWLEVGKSGGSSGDAASGDSREKKSSEEVAAPRLGVSVMGVSNIQELEETMEVWSSILDGMDDAGATASVSGRGDEGRERSQNRKKDVQERALGIKEKLGSWYNYAWESPGPDFVKQKS